MVLGRDWVTPRVNGVRYFETPPLLYWLMSASFGAAGGTPFAARFLQALAAVSCAEVKARLRAGDRGTRPRQLTRAPVPATPCNSISRPPSPPWDHLSTQ